jgi:pilus assembly protein CpaE
MPQQISIVIIDADSDSRKAIELLIAPYADKIRITGSVGDMDEGLRVIQSAKPAVAIVAVNSLEIGIRDIQNILKISPRTSIFVTAGEKSPDWILGLMRAGAVEYLFKPVDKHELFEALQKAGKQYLDRGLADAPPEGKVVTVYNPVGGMGTTTIAVNLAAALAAQHDKVALVDLNFFSGDVTTFLDMNPKYTLSSLTTNVNRLDAHFLMSVMARHSSGIYLLSEPVDVEETVDITPEQISRILVFLKSVFSYVVIDTGGQLFGANQMTFDNSDQILFNTILTLPALKNANRYLVSMERHGIPRGKIKLLVNRYLPKADIKVEDAEKVLGRKVFLAIPNEYADVIGSINKGQPLVNLYPRSPVTRAIQKLAEAFAS